MAEIDEDAFEALAKRLTEADSVSSPPAQVATGAAASARGYELLLREYDSPQTLEAELRSAGRPRIGAIPKGRSPIVRGTIAAAEHARFEQLKQETGKNESELVREAVHLLLEQHRLVS